jgi:hypothetical protein
MRFGELRGVKRTSKRDATPTTSLSLRSGGDRRRAAGNDGDTGR